MYYYSTNDHSLKVGFEEATIQGQAPGKGLYFPCFIPSLPPDFIKDLNSYAKEEIALRVIQPYVSNDIPAVELERIVAETVAFDFPLVPVTGDIASLELFHGPTLAFKDVGARFMSRCLRYFLRHENKKVTVLVATSGDTGGAVADGFCDVEGVDVIILYPSGKVSAIQELQLTTLGNNISALEVEGSFDDCQQMVKAAFGDKELAEKLFLTSANSINVARWLPQQFYYFFGYMQWAEKQPPVISVPSGNFGNICAGLLAHRSGLPVQKFIAACNANDVMPRYLNTGHYAPKETVPTLSNAMDVGDPSNFNRILELFNHQFHSIKEMISGFTISDAEVKRTIERVYQKHKYLPDPHGAVAYLALERYLQSNAGQKGFFLETAHPIKFNDTVEEIIGETVALPFSIQQLLSKEKKSIKLKPGDARLKEYLMER